MPGVRSKLEGFSFHLKFCGMHSPFPHKPRTTHAGEALLKPLTAGQMLQGSFAQQTCPQNPCTGMGPD